MKLLKLRLYEPYRSLEFQEQKFPKLDLAKGEIDPICLVGLNGCGKSNLLELIADIFYLLESDLLNYKVARNPYVPYADNKGKKEIYFEIDYKISIKGKSFFVRIARPLKTSKPQFYLYKDENYNVLLREVKDSDKCRSYLPLVVAYTSGLNELLSMPFIELQDYYAREVTHQVKVSKNYTAKIDAPIALLLDYDSNAAIVLANYLLNDEKKLSIFKRFARINSLSSFKIVIQLDKAFGGHKVELPTEFENIISDLKKCSTICDHQSNPATGDVYEMDFLVNKVTKSLFRHYFKTPRGLFAALSKLNLLNSLCVQTKYRTTLRTKRGEGKLLRFPTIATLDKIFRVEQVELVLEKPKVRTEYMKISDGEHQFIHMVGSLLLFDDKHPEREVLYLLDEPDTHFNPQWRSEFFRELDKVMENFNYEIVFTTHSPFILGDCHGYNVFVFERNPKTNKVGFERSNYETFGANFSFLLKNMFAFEHQMSDKSYAHLIKLEKDIMASNKTGKEAARKKISGFEKELRLYGESVEKLLLVNELGRLKNKINRKK